MGVMLHTQKVTGEQDDYPVIDLEEAIILFNAFPWEKEMDAWEQLPEEGRDDFMPLFQLADDTEHSLRLTAYSRDRIGLAYDYPIRGRLTFAGREYEQGYFGTNQFPRDAVRELFTLFFTSDEDSILSLLEKYPNDADPDEEPFT